VATLASGMQPAGLQRLRWEASHQASGVYLLRLQTPQGNTSQRLTIVK